MTTPKTCGYEYAPTRFKCNLPVWAGHDKLCVLHDPDLKKRKDVVLFNSTLAEKVARETQDNVVTVIDLSCVTFPSDLDWSGKRIAKPVSFRGASFSGAAYFSGTRFNGAADFYRARFSGAANFYRASFSGEASFGRASFSGEASFGRASFSGDAYFSGASFSGDAYFSGASFSGDAYFSGASFKETVAFDRTIFLSGDPKHEVSFEIVAFQKPAVIHFRHVDLSRASFLHTDVREVRFVGVTWASLPEHALWPLPVLKGWKAGRHGIRGHVEMEEERKKRPATVKAGATVQEGSGGQIPARPPQEVERTYRSVAEQYRQLRLNYEGSKQEIEAGDFYIGQMDMRRLDDKEYPWLYRWLLNGYRTVALYGESYIRPLFFYFAFAFLFAWAYQWRGYVAYTDGLFTALTAGQLFREIPKGIDGWEKLFVFGNMLADILLLTLTVVALRRRFHR